MLGIAYIRQLYNLSLMEFAVKMGVSNQMVSMWERGIKPIAKKRLIDLSKEFGIPEEYFQQELSELDKLEIQKNKLKNDYEAITIKVGTEEVEGKSINRETMYALQVNSVRTKKELMFQEIEESLMPIKYDEEYIYINKDKLLGYIKMYNHFAEIIKSRLVPIEVVRSALRAILHRYNLESDMYYGFESDEEINLTTEIFNSIEKYKDSFEEDDSEKIYL